MLGKSRPRRLIEVALPIAEISREASREKSIRHGHISTLHIWWARRPLVACRAIVFGSLVPDPDDPECPQEFRDLVNELLPAPADGIEDTARSRMVEFIKVLCTWEASLDEKLIGKARKLILAANGGKPPKVLDPFAGGGSIPLEALRLGCEAYAVELNPVAHIIELCTLVYPQKYGRPTKRMERDEKTGMEVEREVKCPLAEDVRRWGEWVLEEVRKEIGHLYPNDPEGGVPVAYLWARTVKCPNPACGGEVPLVRQLWLANRPKRKVALKIAAEHGHAAVGFRVVYDHDIDFDPKAATMRRGSATCPFCHHTAADTYLRAEGQAGRMGERMIAVAMVRSGKSGKEYRASTDDDEEPVLSAAQVLASEAAFRPPDEPLPPVGVLGFRVNRYGFERWRDLFNPRQVAALLAFAKGVRRAYCRARTEHAEGYARAVATCLALAVDRLSDYNSSLQTWHNTRETLGHTFTRQALPMVWDYAELNPFSGATGAWEGAIDWIARVVEHCSAMHTGAQCLQGKATRLPCSDAELDAVVTDPAYYDSVPYADLSDFFYVWLKRSLGDVSPDLFQTPLTPKAQEIIMHPHRHHGTEKAKLFYERQMASAFQEIHRVLQPGGTATVVFAHKSTFAWEALLEGLVKSGLVVTASWPLHTEMAERMRARESAALASSIQLICRRRQEDAPEGYYDEVARGLRERIQERLDAFWMAGIRGADFFMSAIGPAVEAFGRYSRVTKLSGDGVSVSEFLDMTREIVSDYALAQILGNGHLGPIDDETRFYVLWRWAYGDNLVPFDDARKLAQALGTEADDLRRGFRLLEVKGENAHLNGPRNRGREERLGEPRSDGGPVPLIDVIHRACLLWDAGDRAELAAFLNRAGKEKDDAFWTVCQSLAEILPEDDPERRLLHGLIQGRESVERAKPAAKPRTREFDFEK
jgi:putative DNA methylase